LAFSHILAGILLRFQQTLLTCPGGQSSGSYDVLPSTCFLYLVTTYRSQEQVFSGPGDNYLLYILPALGHKFEDVDIKSVSLDNFSMSIDLSMAIYSYLYLHAIPNPIAS
jgi:hypothetical protein